MAELTTHTLEVPGAVLTYDIRGGTDTDAPPLLLIGSPMGAAGFGSLAKHFTAAFVLVSANDRIFGTHKHPRTAPVTRPRAPPTGIICQHLGDRGHCIAPAVCEGARHWRR